MYSVRSSLPAASHQGNGLFYGVVEEGGPLDAVLDSFNKTFIIGVMLSFRGPKDCLLLWSSTHANYFGGLSNASFKKVAGGGLHFILDGNSLIVIFSNNIFARALCAFWFMGIRVLATYIIPSRNDSQAGYDIFLLLQIGLRSDTEFHPSQWWPISCYFSSSRDSACGYFEVARLKGHRASANLTPFGRLQHKHGVVAAAPVLKNNRPFLGSI